MGIEDLLKVELDGIGRYKFVVLEVSDSGSKEKVLVAKSWCEYHRDIVNNYGRENPSIDIKVRGGGRVYVTEQEIHAYGYSGDYGEASQETVENLLAEYVKKTGQTLKVDIGKGY